MHTAIGCLGFLPIHLFDIVSLKRLPGAKPFTWILGSGLLAYLLIKVCFAPDKLSLPIWSTWLGWPLLLIFLFLLIYSLFINLPFRKTYVTTSVRNKLITNRAVCPGPAPWDTRVYPVHARFNSSFKVKSTALSRA